MKRSLILIAFAIAAVAEMVADPVCAQSSPTPTPDPASDLIWVSVQRLAEMAEQGTPEEQFHIAEQLMLRGEFPAGVKWIRRAAERGLPQAQVNLGVVYIKGYGVEKSEEQAYSWNLKGAEQGSAEGWYNIGLFYQRGVFKKQNDVAALIVWRKAAEGGNPGALHALGKDYYDGIMGVAKNEDLGIYWERKAAAVDSPEGNEGLGNMLEQGARTDLAAAWFYHARAAHLKFPDAAKAAARLEKALPAAQLQAMQAKLDAGVKLLDVPRYTLPSANDPEKWKPLPPYTNLLEHPSPAQFRAASEHYDSVYWQTQALLFQCKLKYPGVKFSPANVIRAWEDRLEPIRYAILRYGLVQDAVAPSSASAAAYLDRLQQNRQQGETSAAQTLARQGSAQFCTAEAARVTAGKGDLGPDDKLHDVYEDLISIYGWR